MPTPPPYAGYVSITLLWVLNKYFSYIQVVCTPAQTAHSMNCLVMAGPQTIAVADDPGNTAPWGLTVGDCITDHFQISGGSDSFSSPVICGTNTGKHSEFDFYADQQHEYFILSSTFNHLTFFLTSDTGCQLRRLSLRQYKHWRN